MSPSALADQIGYSATELEQLLPPGSNLGLGCGNPTAIAALQPGETVLDLGSGAGIDVFLAATKVGPNGRVIGVDMTPAMLERARSNAQQSKLVDRVEFRLGEIEHLPIADASVDVVLSNCVVNLSSDKQQVWNEAYRVLKSGGRMCVEDIVLLRPLPDAVKTLASAWIGCVAGAALLDTTCVMLKQAGFTDIDVKPHDDYVRTLCDANDALYVQIRDLLPADDNDVAAYVTSASIVARKP